MEIGTNNTISTQDLELMISRQLAMTDIIFDDKQVKELASLVLLLDHWNKSLNLTAIKDFNEIVTLHVLDSAVISPILVGQNIADVGTGAGFPGLVLAILNKDKHFTLIDSVAKKLSFVRTVIASLELKNVTIINDRCENIKVDVPFDCIVSRAFAPLSRMVNWCLPLLDKKGCFIAMKANLEEDEKRAIPLSVKIDKIVDLHVPYMNAKRVAVFLSRG